MFIPTLCNETACWCAPKDTVLIEVSRNVCERYADATIFEADLWAMIEACRDTVPPHPRRLDSNAMVTAVHVVENRYSVRSDLHGGF